MLYCFAKLLQVKYSTLAWRPVTAFRSGYPGFNADTEWTQLLSRTPAHPEYPSGHQATVGALLEVIVSTLGGKEKVSQPPRFQGLRGF